VLGVHAQPASLTWITNPHPTGINDNDIVYLGQSGANIVIYDPAAHQADRLPISAAIIKVKADARTCPQVH
jgi:hypothetical protein